MGNTLQCHRHQFVQGSSDIQCLETYFFSKTQWIDMHETGN